MTQRATAYVIRRERPADVATVRALHVAAFPTAVEADLLDALRVDDGWLPAFSLVAERAGDVVGHVTLTRAQVGDVPALGLGPIAVRPDLQGHGLGSALVNAACAAAEAAGEAVVVLLGDPAFYGRLGFGPAGSLAIEPPVAEWAPHFQARPLAGFDPAWHRGPFRYAAPFDAVS